MAISTIGQNGLTVPLTSNTITSASATALTLQSAGTTAVTIDTSQNVGVGTTTPVSNANQKSVTINGTNYSRVDFLVGGSQTAYLYSGSSNTILGTQGASFLGFDTNSAERMRIDSSGYVGIGTSSPSTYGAFAIRKGIAGTWYGVVGSCSFQTSDGANNSFSIIHNSTACYLGTDTTTRLQMFCSPTASGGVYLSGGATSWTSASDERVKENLVPIENGLTKVASLRAVTGNYINDEDKKSRPFLIAQDVHAVLPEAVDHSNPDELGLSYTDVIPLLVASIKELKAELDELKAKVNA